jgi:AraC-like DNA-binding protein
VKAGDESQSAQTRTRGRQEPAIDLSSVEAFLSGARAAGVHVDQMLTACGVTADQRQAARARVSVSQWARIQQAIISTLDDEASGLLRRAQPVGTFLMVCRGFIHCKTVGEGMRRFADSYNLLRTGLSYDLLADRKQASFGLAIDDAEGVKNPVIVEFALIGFHRLFSWLVSDLIQLDAVQMPPTPPPYFAEYEAAFFQTPIQFDRNVYRLTFSSSYLALPIVRTERDLEQYISRFNTALFLPIPRTGKLALTLRAFLQAEMERTGTMPELDQSAVHFGLNPRGFGRRLREEGQSFQEIKSRVRRDIAIHHLSKTSKSMEAIAECAGFSETSAFIRAFRSWTNMTPLAYRKAVSG